MDNSVGIRYDIIALIEFIVSSSYKILLTKLWISHEVDYLLT